MASEKRRAPRVEVPNPLVVMDTLSNESLGLVVNLSVDGMMLIGDKALVDGAVYQVELPTSTENAEKLRIGIECLWVSEADSDDKNWSGFKIIDISESDNTLFASMIDAL